MSSDEATDVGASIRARLAKLPPQALAEPLFASGFVALPHLLDTPTCKTIASWFQEDAEGTRFRKTIDMGRHGYGEGQYRYFAAPLPPLVQTLRSILYAALAPIANDWAEKLGVDERYPADLDAFVERCHAAGQTRPTPLLLRYTAGGYNRLHQDRYGEIAFPLQVVVLLTDPDDFEGGEFLLMEGRPRMQSRGHVLQLERGDAIVFAGDERPVSSARGYARARMRHGVSTLHAGERLTLGLIFHDAE